jgi:uncharacterized protein YijF (DUF1287 family)
MVFFKRHVLNWQIAKTPDYQTGDIVCWNLGSNVPHIGIVSSLKSNDGKRPLIIHNIGYGQVT